MSVLRKHAVIEALVWLVVLAAFVIVYFTAEGPEALMASKAKKLIIALFIAMGYGVHFLLLAWVRKRKGMNVVVFDERDEEIQKKANTFAFSFVLLYVFSVSVGLYEIFAQTGCVPVVYLWLLGYSTLSLSFFIPALFTLITDIKSS